MDTPLGQFQFNAEYEAYGFSGHWSTDEGSRGTWEASKAVRNIREIVVSTSAGMLA